MSIKVGDKLPAGQLYEFVEEERPGEAPELRAFFPDTGSGPACSRRRSCPG